MAKKNIWDKIQDGNSVEYPELLNFIEELGFSVDRQHAHTARVTIGTQKFDILGGEGKSVTNPGFLRKIARDIMAVESRPEQLDRYEKGGMPAEERDFQQVKKLMTLYGRYSHDKQKNVISVLAHVQDEETKVVSEVTLQLSLNEQGLPHSDQAMKSFMNLLQGCMFKTEYQKWLERQAKQGIKPVVIREEEKLRDEAAYAALLTRFEQHPGHLLPTQENVALGNPADHKPLALAQALRSIMLEEEISPGLLLGRMNSFVNPKAAPPINQPINLEQLQRWMSASELPNVEQCQNIEAAFASILAGRLQDTYPEIQYEREQTLQIKARNVTEIQFAAWKKDITKIWNQEDTDRATKLDLDIQKISRLLSTGYQDAADAAKAGTEAPSRKLLQQVDAILLKNPDHWSASYLAGQMTPGAGFLTKKADPQMVQDFLSGKHADINDISRGQMHSALMREAGVELLVDDALRPKEEVAAELKTKGIDFPASRADFQTMYRADYGRSRTRHRNEPDLAKKEIDPLQTYVNKLRTALHEKYFAGHGGRKTTLHEISQAVVEAKKLHGKPIPASTADHACSMLFSESMDLHSMLHVQPETITTAAERVAKALPEAVRIDFMDDVKQLSELHQQYVAREQEKNKTP